MKQKGAKIILGKNVKIGKNVLLGVLPRDGPFKELLIGDNSTIRSGTVIYVGVKIGNNFQTGHNALIREDNIIGNKVSIGTNAALEPGNRIGNNVRIHTGCFLESVSIGNNVIVGPNTVFTDDLHPFCPRYKECVLGAKVGDNVSIGANVTLLPGIEIGEGSLIGAGSVVTKDVLRGFVVVGNPARVVKKVSELICLKGFYKVPYEWRQK